MKRLLALAGMAAAGTLLITQPALAEGKGHGKGHEKGQGKSHGKWNDDRGHDRGYQEYRGHDDRDHGRDGWDSGGLNITIDFGDRDYISHYLSNSYHTNCPPGLAKKHNGCLPPGQAKKRYRVGHPLPEGVFFEPVPMDLLGHLRPPPYGYRYVQVDQDVLLIGEATKHVVDAVTLLSAVGR